MENTTGYALDWDSPIENDGDEWEVLPEGDYNFEVTGFDRARHAGSAKLPPCPKAILEIRLTGEGGTTTIKHNLFLHSKTEGMVCAFFRAIGQRQLGEKMVMDWRKVVGSTGRCKVIIKKWAHNKTGEEMTGNEIKKFYAPDIAAAPAAAPAKPNGFEPGKGF